MGNLKRQAGVAWLFPEKSLGLTQSRYVGSQIFVTSTRPWTGQFGEGSHHHKYFRAKYFAVFDSTSGFHQIAVDPESSKLLNITTVFGNFVLKVLGQGLCSSQDLFNYLS